MSVEYFSSQYYHPALLPSSLQFSLSYSTYFSCCTETVNMEFCTSCLLSPSLSYQVNQCGKERRLAGDMITVSHRQLQSDMRRHEETWGEWQRNSGQSATGISSLVGGRCGPGSHLSSAPHTAHVPPLSRPQQHVRPSWDCRALPSLIPFLFLDVCWFHHWPVFAIPDLNSNLIKLGNHKFYILSPANAAPARLARLARVILIERLFCLKYFSHNNNVYWVEMELIVDMLTSNLWLSSDVICLLNFPRGILGLGIWWWDQNRKHSQLNLTLIENPMK